MTYLINNEENNFFDESDPIKVKNVVINSSSISTTNIDGYRQGVEITTQRHFDYGIVKIHAGEKRHEIKQNSFGLTRFNLKTFVDYDRHDPVTFINTRYTRNVDDSDSYLIDGAIEVFTIRKRTKADDKNIKGMLQSGNETSESSDIVVHVYEKTNTTNVSFNDSSQVLIQNVPKTKIEPFNDKRLIRNNLPETQENDIINVLSLMSSTTDSYISYDKLSAVSGFVYDSMHGTDSISFGGFTFK